MGITVLLQQATVVCLNVPMVHTHCQCLIHTMSASKGLGPKEVRSISPGVGAHPAFKVVLPACAAAAALWVAG